MRDKLALTIRLVLLISALAGALISGLSTAAHPADAAPALYKRLGGYDAIAAVSDDFLGRLASDKQMSRFFIGVSADSLRKLRQHVVDQLCEGAGGPCYYFSRTMKTVHAGLGITEADWQVTIKHLIGTLEKFKVPDAERSEVLKMFSSLKSDIVEKP